MQGPRPQDTDGGYYRLDSARADAVPLLPSNTASDDTSAAHLCHQTIRRWTLNTNHPRTPRRPNRPDPTGAASLPPTSPLRHRNRRSLFGRQSSTSPTSTPRPSTASAVGGDRPAQGPALPAAVEGDGRPRQDFSATGDRCSHVSIRETDPR